jgi:hypothetical protein
VGKRRHAGRRYAETADDVALDGATVIRVADLDLVTLELLFEETDGDPLNNVEADALIEDLFIYLDDGSGEFELTDTLVATVADLMLMAGVQTVAFADGDANVQIAQGTPRTYFVVVGLTANASSQMPNSFRVTHLTEASSTGEDAANDLPLALEFAADVSSSVVQAGVSCFGLTLSHVGMGLDPVASPGNSVGCPAGEYVEGELISLTAFPGPGFLVDGWNGTDNDSSTSTMNTLTMPAAAHAVSVTYAFPTDVVITDTTYGPPGAFVIEACNSIVAGPGVIIATGADVTFRAFTSIVLDDGVTVEEGATFVIDQSVPAPCP